MRVEARAYIYLLLSEEHHGYTMFLQVKISLLTLPHHLPQLHTTQNTPLEDSEAKALKNHHLTFSSSDEESPIPDRSPLHRRAEPPSPAQHHMDYHCTSTPGTDDSFQDVTAEEKEDFPTAPLDDDIWLEDPVPDRHCVFMNSDSHIFCVLIPIYTAWICYNPLQKTPQHHTMR